MCHTVTINKEPQPASGPVVAAAAAAVVVVIVVVIIIKSSDIKGETESTIVAAHDQAISTNYFKNKILKEEIENKCRLCKQHEETIDLLTSGCSILAKNEYLMRHDKVCSH